MADKKLEGLCKDAFKSCEFDVKGDSTPNIEKPDSYGIGFLVECYSNLVAEPFTGVDQFYEAAIAAASKSLPYTAKDIADYCREMPVVYQDVKHIGINAPVYKKMPQIWGEGYFISALVNSIIKEDETIEISPHRPVDALGYMHSKGTLIINGSISVVGVGMTGGIVRVNGKVGLVGLNISGGEVWEGDRRVYPK